jgi:hypothetical protein
MAEKSREFVVLDKVRQHINITLFEELQRDASFAINTAKHC